MPNLILALLLTTPGWSQDAIQNPQLASMKAFYQMVRTNVLKAAENMPEEKYSFRPADDVRTFGQMVAHIADGQIFLLRYCERREVSQQRCGEEGENES